MKKYLVKELDSVLKLEVEKYKDLFNKVYDLIHIEVFEAKENIVNFNKEITMLRYVLKGRAKITMVHEDGKSSIIHFVKPNEFIGELTLINIEKQPKDVIAISQCICLSIPLIVARDILLNDNKFLLMLNRYIGMKLLNRTWFNVKLQNYELKNKLAAYILISENKGIYQEKHTETAEFLGVSYRHLLYTIKIFQDEGLLIKLKKGYEIDYDKLKALSKDIE